MATKKKTETETTVEATAAEGMTALATTTAPGPLSTDVDYGEDADAGFDDKDSSFQSVPFLLLLQPTSPIVAGGDAKAGNFLDKATGEVFDGKEGIRFVAGEVKREFVEWGAYGKGGGFVASHSPDSDLALMIKSKQRVGKFVLDNGNEVIETFSIYGAMLDANNQPTGRWFVAGCKSTNIKEFQRWFGQLNGQLVDKAGGGKARVPLFGNLCILKSDGPHKNDQGVWFQVKIEPAIGTTPKESRIAPDHPAYQAGRALRELVRAGIVQADHASNAAETVASNGEDTPF